MKKLMVNLAKCNACGACALECSLVYERSDGKVEVTEPGFIADSMLIGVREVVENCPCAALSIEEHNLNIDIGQLKNEMHQLVEVKKPDYEQYAFLVDDKNEYADDAARI